MTAAQVWFVVGLVAAVVVICLIVCCLDTKTNLDAHLRRLIPGDDE